MSLWSSLSGLALPQLSTLYCNIARWPLAGRLLVGAVLALLLLLAGDAVYLGGAREVLQRQEAGEVALRQQFAAKARQAAQYDGVARELENLRIAFNEQLRQMPTLTQMPGLLEDFARLGQASGVLVEQLSVLDEQVQPVFVERPMQLRLLGTYHDLLAFISGVAGLGHIVTLHDFVIRPVSPQDGALLSLTMLAKTYRYSNQGALP
ncbi:MULTISPECIES: type 4a pilus biogenesis protein PilO [Pseudomonas]|uniref:type 4a pilus biogenesis protein PilO n=1 Tax=Pseudomonas TaxID=286 RepID=UPI000CF31F70|nr:MULTISPECIES: type 4a pilus biogenesis protein PilO [unclassified Pseudomonas]NMZ03838.1 type 4a pilus biogenesis protein PilO [Pseudomonas proteolytica]QHG21858.1 type 4a pilus biogenesis protein PilO [Pseudomonas sp. DTU12.1]